MKRITIILALAVFLVAVAASAAQTKIFEQYERVRQALLNGSADEAQTAARALAETARAEKQNAVAERSEALAAAANLKGARDSFAMLSEEMIRFRDARSGRRPEVAYCSMHKASWLQPKGAITNPYAEDKSMLACGEFRKEHRATPAPPHRGHH